MTAVLEPIFDEIVLSDDEWRSLRDRALTAASVRITPIDVETDESTEVRTITGRLNVSIPPPQPINVGELSRSIDRAFEGFATAARTASEGLRLMGSAHQRMIERSYGAPLADGLEEINDRAVERGVKFLDETFGRDTWLPRMNVATLDVATANNCALAQASGEDYGNAVDIWDIRDSTKLGFSTQHSYAALTETWRRKIVELRAATVSA